MLVLLDVFYRQPKVKSTCIYDIGPNIVPTTVAYAASFPLHGQNLLFSLTYLFILHPNHRPPSSHSSPSILEEDAPSPAMTLCASLGSYSDRDSPFSNLFYFNHHRFLKIPAITITSGSLLLHLICHTLIDQGDFLCHSLNRNPC